jgi:hypothetical protein
LSYVIGVIFSSFAELIFSKVRSNKEVIPLNDDLKIIVMAAFREAFKIPQNVEIKWSRDHFYLCRSIVYERVPSVLPYLQRQSSLRQLRISLIPTFFVWLLVGIVWGIQNILGKSLLVGSIIIALSLVMFIALVLMTVDRAKSNEWREVPEVLTAFGASYRESHEKTKLENKRPLLVLSNLLSAVRTIIWQGEKSHE